MSEFIRHRLTLAYCGTPWRGWQRQPGGQTVQDQLEAAIHRLTKWPLPVQGASRTDAGVHALGQVVHFDPPKTLRLGLDGWLRGLNDLLPETIRALALQPTAPDFDACRSAVGKVYRYRIWRGRQLDPFLADRVWHLPGSLDLNALRQAAALLVGTHNFVRLSANRGDQPEEARRRDVAGSTRTLDRLEVIESEDELVVEVEGNAFLYRMVRVLVGSLMQVARGRESRSWLSDLIGRSDGLQSHQTAPAGGLYLVRVNYPGGEPATAAGEACGAAAGGLPLALSPR
jgi:tRNA pseudouridine38-40 synthase